MKPLAGRHWCVGLIQRHEQEERAVGVVIDEGFGVHYHVGGQMFECYRLLLDGVALVHEAEVTLQTILLSKITKYLVSC